MSKELQKLDVQLPAQQQELKREQIDLIKNTIAKGCTDEELELFLYTCKRTGLDPLARQLYAVKRWNNKLKKEEMTIQTGIDGYRLIAQRTGEYAGCDIPIFEHKMNKIVSCTYTVYRLMKGHKCQFSAIAYFDEYKQEFQNKEGGKYLSTFWEKMPHVMLEKVAEAKALRKAFPQELSNIYTNEEMQQSDSEQYVEATIEPERPALTKQLTNKSTKALTVSDLIAKKNTFKDLLNATKKYSNQKYNINSPEDFISLINSMLGTDIVRIEDITEYDLNDFVNMLQQEEQAEAMD